MAGENPQSAPAQAPTLDAAPKLTLMGVEINDHKNHLADYLKIFEASTPEEKQKFLQEKQEFLAKASKMDLHTLRNGGVSLEENQKDPQKRFTLLSRAFLTRQENNRGIEFKINLPDPKFEKNIGLGDIFPHPPPGIEVVDVYNEKGKLVFANAVRKIINGRDGYYVLEEQDLHPEDPNYPMTSDQASKDKGAQKQHNYMYASIHSGYSVVVKMTSSKERTPTPQQQKEQIEAGVNFTRNKQKQLLSNAIIKAGLALPNPLKFNFDQDFYDLTLERIMRGNFPDIAISEEAWQLVNAKGEIEKFQNTGAYNSAVIDQWARQFVALYQDSQEQQAKTPTPQEIKQRGNQPQLKAKVASADAPVPQPIDRKGTAKDLAKPYQAVEGFNYERITRDWLFNNVARTEQELRQRQFLVKDFKFLDATLHNVNRLIIPYLLEAQARMKALGVTYHLKEHVCSCQNWRPIRGGTSQSMHSWGTAIDLNTDIHKFGSEQTDMPQDFVDIMKSCGFTWGGEFKPPRQDPMHFQLAINPYTSIGLLKDPKALQAAQTFLHS